MGNNTSSNSRDTRSHSHRRQLNNEGVGVTRDNNGSSTSNLTSRIAPILRRNNYTGKLGLSHNELDRMCKPSGLYQSCTWDDKSIRRFIGDGKIAARQVGLETPTKSSEECPICFLNYTEINVTSCCKAHICTECYLQVHPMNSGKSSSSSSSSTCPLNFKESSCPFCSTEDFSVSICKNLKAADDVEKDTEIPSSSKSEIPSPEETVEESLSKSLPKEGEFGSFLKKRTASNASDLSSSTELSNSSSIGNASNLIQSFALSTKEREEIEEQMRQQHNHPLSRQMDEEAEELRRQHDRSYRRTMSDRLSERRGFLSRAGASAMFGGSSRNFGEGGRRARNWGGRSNNGRYQTLDDLLVIEAAILLSMEQEAAQMRAAAAEEEGENGRNGSREARTSLPMLQALLSRRAAQAQANSSSENNGGDEGDENENDEDDEEERRRRSPLSSRLGRHSRGRSRHHHHHWMPGGSEAVATATMLLRGVSEEEQLEMAIAASLREQEQQEAAESVASESDGQSSEETNNTNESTPTNDNDNANDTSDGDNNVEVANVSSS